MTRIMYDAADPANIPPLRKQLVAGYVTGPPGVAWKNHWNDFPGKIMVRIDQAASPGAPDYSAHVIDVEPGAYRPADIPGWMKHATAPRPTVYCDRNDYPDVRSVFRGPIWLAAPGLNSVPSGFTNIIGIQNVFAGRYDASVIFDDAWPFMPSAKETEMLHGMLQANTQEFIPFPAGSFRKIIFFHDFTDHVVSVRMAANSAAKGYTEIKDTEISHSTPVEVPITESDCDGISLASHADVPVGWTLA